MNFRTNVKAVKAERKWSLTETIGLAIEQVQDAEVFMLRAEWESDTKRRLEHSEMAVKKFELAEDIFSEVLANTYI